VLGAGLRLVVAVSEGVFLMHSPYGLRNLMPQTGKSAGLRYNFSLTSVSKW